MSHTAHLVRSELLQDGESIEEGYDPHQTSQIVRNREEEVRQENAFQSFGGIYNASRVDSEQ